MSPRNKRVFVSDIHMGDEASINPPTGFYAYGWLGAHRAESFAKFLESKLNDPEVKEVIILGDLFDDWVCPVTIDPVPDPSTGISQFKKIAQSKQNRKIIENLNKIADNPEINLIYVPGNHDMLIDEGELKEIIPNISYMTNGPGEGVFSADGINAEHGNSYCLFNAPDTYSNPTHSLPLGFFISRAVADEVYRTGKSVNSVEVLLEAIERLLGAADFAKSVFEAVVEEAGLQQSSIVKMNGIDGYSDSVTIAQATQWFADLYEQWEPHKPGNVNKFKAVLDDAGLLGLAAKTQYFEPNHGKGIVIFGHTHKYVLRGDGFDENDPDPESLEIKKTPSQRIYANCGTWIDAKKSTYIETQLDQDAGKHYVRLWQHHSGRDADLLSQRFIKI
ncbi:MAG: metallophosphoesterase [Desulfuromonadales bacterium]|nr:metallophosphoesterase [Desulfuromonadales bacterium]